MRDNGLLEGWKRKWWPKNQNCRPMKTTEAKPATLNDTQVSLRVYFMVEFQHISEIWSN